MIDPEREKRRAAAAQQQAQAQARTDMAAPGADMVAVFSVAGFELADIFAEWARRIASGGTGLGPTHPEPTETPEEFGQRMARGILRLIKEV